jgi:outer membrane biosynthesis protein TonB
MAFLDTRHKRRSALYTTIIGVLLLVIMFFFGLTYFDPPIEYGIAVNFGTSEVGSGNVQPTEALKPATSSESESEPVEETVEELEEEQVEETDVAESEEAAEPAESEKVITQESEEALAIKKAEEERKIREAKEKEEARKKAEAARKAEEERQRKIREENERRERERQEQEAKRKNLDALMGGFSESNGNAEGGEGDDNQPGDKGKETGDPNASGYYGIGGDGSGGNYRLGNRKAITRPKPEYDCNEEGRVVVTISVDQTGKVISAQAGVKGTTNSASCLLSRAREAALKTKFNADSNAPSKQVGQIIYNFTLSE